MDESKEEKSNPQANTESGHYSSPLKQIRTFQGDVAEALARQQESLVSIQRAESVRKEESGPRPATPEKKVGHIFLLWLGTILLLTIGSGVGWYAYITFVNKTSTPLVTAPPNRFISVNAETPLVLTSLSRDILISRITEALGQNNSQSLEHIILQKEVPESSPVTLTTQEFISGLSTSASGALIRSFDKLFMLGSLGDSTFLIIRLASFENAFAGMLNWEKSMAQDLGPLFQTRELMRDIAPGSVFIDVTDRNKDVRALLIDNRPALLYSFYDNNMLIITDSMETLRSLIDRLTREKLSR